MALSLLPPPDSIVHIIMEECGDYDSLALLSSTERRRIRNWMKRQIWRQIQQDPYMPLAREHLLSLRRELENAGYTDDTSRIGKLRDRELEINERFQHLQIDDLPDKLKLMVKRNPDAVNLLWEFAIYGSSTLDKIKLRRNSPVWAVLDLDPEQLKGLPPTDGFLLLLSRLKIIFGWNGSPLAESRAVQLAQCLLGAYLPPDNELKRNPAILADAVEAGVIHRGIEIKDKETGETVEIDIKDPHSSDFIHETEASKADDRREAIIRLFALKGITYEDLPPKDWSEIFERDELFDAGYEFNSKTGMSISSFYGANAHKKEQRWSRIKKKIRNLMSS